MWCTARMHSWPIIFYTLHKRSSKCFWIDRASALWCRYYNFLFSLQPINLRICTKYCTKNIIVWLRCNKLLVNITLQKKHNHNFSISLDGQLLRHNNATKFLGVYIDEHFTWKVHINCLCKQISKSIGMSFRSRFYLSSKTKLTLYYSLILSIYHLL